MADSATTAVRDNEGHDSTSPWQMPWTGWKQVLKRTWGESSDDHVSIVAAGVAFYGFLAMVPMLAATILIYGLVADPHTVVSHASALTKMLPGDVGQLVGEQLVNVEQTSGSKKGIGLIIALAVALWGARNAASSIITALNIAYEEEESRSFLRVTLLALAMTLGAIVLALLAGAAIAVMTALEGMIPQLGGIGAIVGKIVTYLFLGAIAAAAAATLFRYGPARDEARWEWLTPGSLFFAVAWILMTLAFGFYVSNFGSYGATYGSLSAVVVLLTWLYLSSYVLLLGGELNSELEHQTAKDTTEGGSQPLGERDAWVADHVAGRQREDDGGTHGRTSAADHEQPALVGVGSYHQKAAREHPFIASRVTANAGRLVGFAKVGTASSVLATLGLARLRRRGSELSGAILLGSAAALSLIRRSRDDDDCD